jgi:hypothetical protein
MSASEHPIEAVHRFISVAGLWDEAAGQTTRLGDPDGDDVNLHPVRLVGTVG